MMSNWSYKIEKKPSFFSYPTVSDLDVKTPSSSTQVSLEQLLNEELQSPPPCLQVIDNYKNDGSQFQGAYCAPQGNPRVFDCPSIQITSISHNVHVEAGSNLEDVAAGGAEAAYYEPSWNRDQLYLPLDASYRESALSPSPCSSLSSRSWVSDLSSCDSFSHVNNYVDGELRDAALLALGSPGCGGGAFGVELWQQKYQHPVAFSPVLSPYQSPRQSPSHSPRTSIIEDTWLNCWPNSRWVSSVSVFKLSQSCAHCRSIVYFSRNSVVGTANQNVSYINY